MIELLESRIAPAAVLHLVEADGDRVTIKTNKGTKADLVDAVGHDDFAAVDADGFIVNFLTTSNPSTFRNVNLTISATRHGGGDGFANQVRIEAYDNGNANSIDLGRVKLDGDLIYIDAGNSDFDTLAIRRLTVHDLVHANNSPDAASVSDLHGNVGSILVKGDMNGYLAFADNAPTTIRSMVILGNMGDQGGTDGGRIFVAAILNLTIGGTLNGDGDPGNALITAVVIRNAHVHEVGLQGQIGGPAQAP